MKDIKNRLLVEMAIDALQKVTEDVEDIAVIIETAQELLEDKTPKLTITEDISKKHSIFLSLHDLAKFEGPDYTAIKLLGMRGHVNGFRFPNDYWTFDATSYMTYRGEATKSVKPLMSKEAIMRFFRNEGIADLIVRKDAARYFSVQQNTIEFLVDKGYLHTIKLPEHPHQDFLEVEEFAELLAQANKDSRNSVTPTEHVAEVVELPKPSIEVQHAAARAEVRVPVISQQALPIIERRRNALVMVERPIDKTANPRISAPHKHGNWNVSDLDGVILMNTQQIAERIGLSSALVQTLGATHFLIKYKMRIALQKTGDPNRAMYLTQSIARYVTISEEGLPVYPYEVVSTKQADTELRTKHLKQLFTKNGYGDEMTYEEAEEALSLPKYAISAWTRDNRAGIIEKNNKLVTDSIVQYLIRSEV